MSDTKSELRYFTIPQWKQEEAYLREQHRNGWKFVKVSGLGMYHFEKCAPEDVVYQLDYNDDSTRQKAEYIQLFEDCGWEYLQNYVGYSYFRKAAAEMNGAEEIFCDDTSRLEFMKRVYRGRMLPLLAIFFLGFIPQLFFTVMRREFVFTAIIGVMLVIYLAIFISFAIPFWKYYQSVHLD